MQKISGDSDRFDRFSILTGGSKLLWFNIKLAGGELFLWGLGFQTPRLATREPTAVSTPKRAQIDGPGPDYNSFRGTRRPTGTGGGGIRQNA